MVFSARPSEAGDALARLSWQDFEHLLAEYYREQGFRVERVTAHDLKALSHAGMDLRLRRGSETSIVQCGHWDAIEVDVDEVNTLISDMLNEAASRGVLVTRGRFTPAAQAAVRRQPRIQLVDGDVLRVLLKLPDHLDVAPPGSRPAEKVAKKAAVARRRARKDRPRAMPIAIGVVVVALFGLFIWRAVGTHDTPQAIAAAPVTTPAPAAAPPAPVASTASVVAPAPASTQAVVAETPALAPAPTASVGVTVAPGTRIILPRSREPAMSPSLVRELAERERLSKQDESASRKKNEDALKVMERNTREVGGY
ncbi:restriction endonuclease [Bacillus sp. NP157]|nr:restriction endonuclease [Bacillus sp. NP157]